MEGQTPQSFLPASSPCLQQLSFCDSQPKAFNRWLQTLPKANLGELAKQVYNALLELNQLITPQGNRLALLELLRAEVLFICQQLEPELLSQPILLDKRAQQIARLCQSLQEHLAAGYKRIILEQMQASNINRNDMLGLALQRTLHTLRALLMRSCQLHRAPTTGLWLEIHSLYQTACKFGLQQMPQTDSHSLLGEISIEQTWLTAALLGCVRTNQLHQDSIAPLLIVFETWASRVKLQAASAESSLFVARLNGDQPPCYRFLLSDHKEGSLLGINLSGLVDAIKRQLQPVAQRPVQWPKALNTALLQHLLTTFNEPAERRFERRREQGELTLCVGLRALHYFLAGERSFESMLGQSKQGHAVQVGAWESVTRNSAELIDAFGNFVFASESMSEEACEDYPLYQEQLLNRSDGGYCLSWQVREEAPLAIGELVGIRESGKQGWVIARVSWIMQEGQATQVGVERIADSALPCALQLVRRSAFEQPFLRALLLPSGNGIVPPRLIAPSLPFQQGDQVRINAEGEESLALLEHWQSGSTNFNQFSYRLLGAERFEPTLAEKTRATANSGVTEDCFDALWESL